MNNPTAFREFISQVGAVFQWVMDFVDIGIVPTIILLAASVLIDMRLRPGWTAYCKNIKLKKKVSDMRKASLEMQLEKSDSYSGFRPYLAAASVAMIMFGGRRGEFFYFVNFVGFYIPAVWLCLHYIFLGHRYPKDIDESQV